MAAAEIRGVRGLRWENVLDCKRVGAGWRTCEVDEARALFRMNFYEISRHKTRGGPIGTYVRTLHPGGRAAATTAVAVAIAVAAAIPLSINRLGTGWPAQR